MKLPGQGLFIHSLMSKDSPEQRSPSYLGGGFVQERLRSSYPFPHVVEQLEKLPQNDQTPFTKYMEVHKYKTIHQRLTTGKKYASKRFISVSGHESISSRSNLSF